MRQTLPAQTGIPEERQGALLGGSNPVEERAGDENSPQREEPVEAGTPPKAQGQKGGANGNAQPRKPVVPGRKTQQEEPRTLGTLGTGWALRDKGTQQLAHTSNGHAELEELGEVTPENEQSRGSSPSVELSPYLIRVQGHTTPGGRAVSARRKLPFDEEEALADFHIGIQGAQNGGWTRAEWTLGRL